MIKDYIIKEKLGIGAFGTVYKVQKKSNNNIYVIKRISLIGLTPKQLKNVKLESKILSSVKSPYIVQYYESFEENNFLNIVMEYCDGGDLSEYIYNSKQTKILLEEKKVWNIFLKILLGLYHLHKLKILHRDLKPLNIFLTKNNFNYDIKIGDFGVAKILNQENFASTVIGTPYYLSPELCEELPYNDKSDVWALGCILYELCTYKHPFNAKCQASLVLKILENKPKPINKYYSDELQKLINLILDKNYQTRPSCYDIIHMPFVLDKIKNLGLYDNIEINDNDKSINEKNNLKRNYSNKTFFSVKLNIDDYNKINYNNNIKNIYKNNNINNIKENKQKNINDNTNYKNRFIYISKSIDNFKKLKIQKEQQRKTSNDIIIKKKPINNTKNKDINIKIINKIKNNIDEYEIKIKNEIKTNNIKKYKKPNLSFLNLDNDEDIIKNIKTTDILNNEEIDNMIENKLLKMKKNKKEINIKEFASFLNDNIKKINLTNFKENNNNKIDKKELKFKKLKINI